MAEQEKEKAGKEVKAQFIGSPAHKAYHGTDFVTGRNIVARAGEVVVMSREKLEKLELDYPGQWSDKVNESLIPKPPAAPKAGKK